MSKKKLKKKEIEEINNSEAKLKSPDKSCFVPQDTKMKRQIEIRTRDDLTEKQKGLIQLIKDKKTKIVFISGVAGTSKTFIGVQAGLELLNEKRVSEVLYLRSAIESAQKSLGFLPGDQRSKEEVYMIPLLDKLNEFLDKGTIDTLIKEGRIKSTVVNYLRGQNLNAKYILVDEFQNFSLDEAKTIVTRLGKYSTMVLVGDPMQSDIRNSGMLEVIRMFNDKESQDNGVFCIEFTKEDIVRSGICKFLVERFERESLYK